MDELQNGSVLLQRGLNFSRAWWMVDDTVDQWQKRLEACIRAEGGHFEHLLQRCLPDTPFAAHHNQFFSEFRAINANPQPAHFRSTNIWRSAVR